MSETGTMLYSVTWAYHLSPDRTRTVVGSFQDVDEVYKSLLEQHKFSLGVDRLEGKLLLGARVDAVGKKSAPVLSWGKDLTPVKEVFGQQRLFDMT
tara:strand:+ start:54 stop:341 length:288 start_codon:yes stop_codon:yes gene_type:complete